MKYNKAISLKVYWLPTIRTIFTFWVLYRKKHRSRRRGKKNNWARKSRKLTKHLNRLLETLKEWRYEAEKKCLVFLECATRILSCGWLPSTWVINPVIYICLPPPHWCNKPNWATSASLSRLQDPTQTPHSVGLFWTCDQPVTETSIWQHTALKRDRLPCLQRD